MRRILASLVLVSFVLASCGGAANPSPTPSPGKTFNFFGSPTPTPSTQPTIKPNLPATFAGYHRFSSKVTPDHYSFGLVFSGDTKIYAPFAGTIYFEYLKDNNQNGPYLALHLVAEDGDRNTVSDKQEFDAYFGVLGTDVTTIAKDGTKVKAGDLLVEVVGQGTCLYEVNNPNLVTNGTADQVFGFWIDSSGKYLEMTPELSAKLLNSTSP